MGPDQGANQASTMTPPVLAPQPSTTMAASTGITGNTTTSSNSLGNGVQLVSQGNGTMGVSLNLPANQMANAVQNHHVAPLHQTNGAFTNNPNTGFQTPMTNGAATAYAGLAHVMPPAAIARGLQAIGLMAPTTTPNALVNSPPSAAATNLAMATPIQTSNGNVYLDFNFNDFIDI
jgi:hypothetical protein